MSDRKTRVVVVLEYYLPGINAGGPVRSVANMVERLADGVDFFVITRDRDLGSETRYQSAREGEWMPVGQARVRYLSKAESVVACVAGIPHDTLYLSSYFSPWSVQLLWAKRAGLLRRSRIVVAPRGQFGEQALSRKPKRKRALLALANLAGVHAGITWHATTPAEVGQIRSVSRRGRIVVAGNLSALAEHRPREGRKIAGTLRVLTVARVHPIKNILRAIESLAGLEGEIRHDIIGPHEDPAYLLECERSAARLQRNIQVRFIGPLSHEEVTRRMPDYDLFYLPSAAESFGHSISEALAAGLPVLVSDRTPWRGLSARDAGWDVPLEEPEKFRHVLRECVEMDDTTHARISLAARGMGQEAAGRMASEEIASYREMFSSHADEPRE